MTKIYGEEFSLKTGSTDMILRPFDITSITSLKGFAVLALCTFALMFGMVGHVGATTLSDASLVLDITSDGEFNVIFLNSIPIDDSAFVQRQTVNGSAGLTHNP